jgi:hypothetical protein
MKGNVERQPMEKSPNPFGSSLSIFLLWLIHSRKLICSKRNFDEDFGLLIVKNNLPIQLLKMFGLKCYHYICLQELIFHS